MGKKSKKKKVKLAFENEGVTLKLSQILPTKTIPVNTMRSAKYQRILSSVKSIGVVEPLVVCRQRDDARSEEKYVLLDGHYRYGVLKELGEESAFCLVSTDDETYTYNHHVNRLSTIQEHVMIKKALDSGVDEERLVEVLNINVEKLREKKNVINGLCPESVDMLKEKPVSAKALSIMRRVKPLRQIEMSELMVATNNYTIAYVKALYLATTEELLVDEGKKEAKGVTPEDISRMEKEMESLERDLRTVEESYAQNVLKLVLARGYLRKLLNNARVVRYLSKERPEFLEEFNRIVESEELSESS